MAKKAKRFGRDESGSIVVMTITFLILMLIVGGMAVDFIRFESKRAMLQSTADRAVLAAADLTQDKDSAAVVIDYFEKAGYGDSIIGEPDIVDSGNYKSVGVVAKLELNTMFLNMLGIQTLTAPAASTAVEGVADIEISLIVDISGSMAGKVTNADGSTGTQTKIEALRTAAETFATNILKADYAGRISLSLVPYSEQVNAGPDLFNPVRQGYDPLHNFSHCIDFNDTDFDTLAMQVGHNYTQTQHFQWNPYINSYGQGDNRYNQLTNTICPRFTYERIVPLTQDLTSLTTTIKKLQPRAGTAIHVGLKWGLALLDPSMQSVVTGLISNGKVSGDFEGRPAAYTVEGQAMTTQKVIVLMTDGKNDFSERLYDWAYDTPSERAFWAANNRVYTAGRDLYHANISNFFYQRYTRDEADLNTATVGGVSSGDYLMQELCTLAKAKDIIIYTVAVESGSHGAAEMAECASSPAHYFSVKGDEMNNVFAAIARQVTELRLSL